MDAEHACPMVHAPPKLLFGDLDVFGGRCRTSEKRDGGDETKKGCSGQANCVAV